MTDRFSKEVRSRIMSSIRSKNTKPELKIRKNLWSMGHRYRIHDKSVFGTPDISNKSRKVAVFIDGCFWHGCKRCYVEPKTNSKFWKEKILHNKERRKKVTRVLKKEDWTIMQFWEHQIERDPLMVSMKIAESL